MQLLGVFSNDYSSREINKPETLLVNFKRFVELRQDAIGDYEFNETTQIGWYTFKQDPEIKYVVRPIHVFYLNVDVDSYSPMEL